MAKDKAPGGNGKGGGDAPSPPAAVEEVVIGVPVHCDGCARKLRRSLQQRLDGVGDVTVDSRTNRVVLRGRRAAENAPEAVKIVQRKTGEKAVLLSPSPASEKPSLMGSSPEKKGHKGAKKPDAAADVGANKGGVADDELPEMDMKMATVLRINLHCDACCEEIKRRILKITGVEEAVPHLKSSQMLVKGKVEPATLVGFIHKCTGRKSGILRAEPLPDDLPQPKTPSSPPPAPAVVEAADTNKKDEPPAAENSSSSEKKKNGGGEVEEKKGGGAEEEDDNNAGDKNPKAAEEKETTHGAEEEAPAGNAAGADAGDGGLVVENHTNTKDDRLFTVPMPAGVVTVAPEVALKNAVDPYYCYPPPYYAHYYAHQNPYYQYPQPYPAYAMYGYPHPHYPQEAFSEENPNACTIV